MSILFISLTQRQKSSAYDSNLAQAILKRQWNSFSLTYSLTISTKLSLYLLQKEEYLNHVYGYDAVFSRALYFFLFSLTSYSLSYSYVEIYIYMLSEDSLSVTQMLFLANLEIHNVLFRWFRNIHSNDEDGHRKRFHFDVHQSERTLHRSHST